MQIKRIDTQDKLHFFFTQHILSPIIYSFVYVGASVKETSGFKLAFIVSVEQWINGWIGNGDSE